MRYLSRYIRKISFFCNDCKLTLRNFYYRKKFLNCGSGLKIYGRITVLSGKKVTIGKDCRINNNVYINGRSGVTIGDSVTLSAGAKVISIGYDTERFLMTGERIHITSQPIFIGNHVWVCADAIILPGVNITGNNIIVAAGAVVTHSITENSVIVAGNPAKVIKRLVG